MMITTTPLRQLSVSFLLLLSCFSISKADEPTNVVELNSGNFEHLTQASTGQTTGKWFVKFFAPWCGHCKNLEPIWDQLANDLNIEESSVNVARVDCTTNNEVCQRFGVTGFPTLKFIADYKVFTYKGKRGLDELKAFVDGAYKELEGEEVPPLPSWMGDLRKILDHDLDSFQEDLNHIIQYRKNAAAALIIVGMVWGALLSSLFGMLFSKKSKAKKD